MSETTTNGRNLGNGYHPDVASKGENDYVPAVPATLTSHSKETKVAAYPYPNNGTIRWELLSCDRALE